LPRTKVRDGQKTNKTKKGKVKLIPGYSEVRGNKRVDEAVKNALEKDINDREHCTHHKT
jgi:hypothetical protein